MNLVALSNAPDNLEAFVLAWPGNEAAAQEIVAEIAPYLDIVTVLYNRDEGSRVTIPPNWINLGKEAYFGAKFEHARKLSRSDIQIFIPADCQVDSWDYLISLCRAAFRGNKRVAIWAPHTHGTAWTPERTILRRQSGQSLSVTSVDSLVWATRGTFLKNLPDLNFASNKFGWGIETAVAAEAHRKRNLVILDLSLSYSHLRGSGYSSNEAEVGEIDFLRNLPSKTLTVVRRIQFIFTMRKLAETKRLNWTQSIKLWTHTLLLSAPKALPHSSR